MAIQEGFYVATSGVKLENAAGLATVAVSKDAVDEIKPLVTDFVVGINAKGVEAGQQIVHRERRTQTIDADDCGAFHFHSLDVALIYFGSELFWVGSA